jgi:hydrogenase small subunit
MTKNDERLPSEKPTIGEHLKRAGFSRRDFMSLCSMLMVTAPVGLALTDQTSVTKIASQIAKTKRPSVIWLHFQDCTGCTETLLRTSKPDVADLILNMISLDYHETLMAACGSQAEASLKQAMQENEGKYILVCEGSIPVKDGGQYLKLGGKNGIDLLKEVASKAAAVISMGSCASWGGVPSADPNPTGATGVDQIIKDKPVGNIPGCPPNPYNLLGVVLEYATFKKLPALDEHNRPLFAYGRLIHDHCPRRAHFDAGRFVKEFSDDGHRQGWCLYKMGCKGPQTHAACSTNHFNEVPDCWPIGAGTPCVGCTEKAIAFRVPIFQLAEIHGATPPETFPGINARIGSVGAAAAGLAGLVAGAIGGAAWVGSHKLPGAAEANDDSKANSTKAGGE